jgi:splicing factor 1
LFARLLEEGKFSRMDDDQIKTSVEGDAKDSLGTANPRKRRNRWGEAQETVDTNVSTSNQDTLAESAPTTEANNNPPSEDNAPKRKSRWAASDSAPKPGGLTDEIIQQTVVLQLQLQQINQKLTTVTLDALRIEQDPNRSPSPPPKYDSNGKRTNTREVRMRESLNQQRIKLIEDLIKLNPTFAPPVDFIKAKPFRRIFIPRSNDPTCNYIGLIIGPRGMTQKQMELETGCKISIRGKGSAKEGSKGRQTKQIDEDEELHVHVQGDTEENVEKAAAMIDLILKPIDDKLNEHKQRQLKQLALINGTFKEDDYCPICGEKGHRQWDCPLRAKSFKATGVKCAICNDLSHPTRDCPFKEKGNVPTSGGGDSKNNADTEYDSFMAEMNDDPRKPKKNTEDGKRDNNEVAMPKPGSGPVFLAPIVDVVTRTPTNVAAITSAYGALPTNTVDTASTASTLSGAGSAASYPMTAASGWPNTTAAAGVSQNTAAAYNPYLYATTNPYAAAYPSYYGNVAASTTASTPAGYDPATYAAYMAAYGYHMAPAAAPAVPSAPLPAYSPPPPPPSNS